jgi:RHS repeat-associated protein
VTPSLGGYSFTPASRAYNNVTNNQTAQDFTAMNVGSAAVFYIHPDHLNTARLIQDQAGNTVWRWDQGEPFGDNVPNNNPSGAGAFDFPLRFPGQYFDRETNLAYNIARDYSAEIGRYVESDPIGLKGGLNTYAYGTLNPLMFSDPSGLAVWFCIRNMRASYMPVANHGYFFDDKTNQCCGSLNPLKSCRERGPKNDSCILISSSDSDTEKLLQCCNKKAEGFYFPLYNDCQNLGEDCIREIGMAPPNTADENRWKKCPSCWRK